jgi:hypothetical protein
MVLQNGARVGRLTKRDAGEFRQGTANGSNGAAILGIDCCAMVAAPAYFRCVSGNSHRGPLANLPHVSCSGVWEQKAAPCLASTPNRCACAASAGHQRPCRVSQRRWTSSRRSVKGVRQNHSSEPFVPSPLTHDGSRVPRPPRVKSRVHRSQRATHRARGLSNVLADGSPLGEKCSPRQVLLLAVGAYIDGPRFLSAIAVASRSLAELHH